MRIWLAIAVAASLAGCGASAAGTRGSPGSLPAVDAQAGSEGGSSASLACETSDDCPPDQICVDSECAIPVPPGFF